MRPSARSSLAIAVSSKLSAASAGPATDWVASLSPWPEEFGLNRMRELLDRLGHPERRYPAIHVVGTNGKSTATRTIAALLQAEGRRAGAYTSPHVSGWAERIWVDGAEADFEQAVARIRPDAIAVGATQFEALTAAALLEFAEREVEVAIVEAGLGGRLDELTNRRGRRDRAADERFARAHRGTRRHDGADREREACRGSCGQVAVLSDNQYEELVPKTAEIVTEMRERRPKSSSATKPTLSCASSFRGASSGRGRELWDGAHTPAGTAWLRERIDEPVEVVVASILADKDVDGMLDDLAALAARLVATASDNPRALPAERLAARAAPRFAEVEIEPDPHVALARARQSSSGLILVTGALCICSRTWLRRRNRAYDDEGR